MKPSAPRSLAVVFILIGCVFVIGGLVAVATYQLFAQFGTVIVGAILVALGARHLHATKK